MGIETLPVQMYDEPGPFHLQRALFLDGVTREPLPYLRQAHWPTDAKDLFREGLSVQSARLDEREQALLGRLHGGALVYLSLSDGHLDVWVGASSTYAVDATMAWLHEHFPAPPPQEGKVSLMLWVLTPNGPRKVQRLIDVPRWEAIAENYAAGSRARLQTLIGARPEAGQIILWHGPPGTGKTYALRSLAWEWRSWCDLHYVVDPDVMFGKEPSYLLQLLMDEPDTGPIINGEPAEPRWRLVVLEDTGEMVAADAKEREGQGLSRLLNVTDGLIGQGLRLLILVTTNEEIRRLHPAVARPGRCAAQIEFTKLDPQEAQRWLEAHGDGHHATGAGTIAELFGVLHGYTESEDRLPVGFSG